MAMKRTITLLMRIRRSRCTTVRNISLADCLLSKLDLLDNCLIGLEGKLDGNTIYVLV